MKQIYDAKSRLWNVFNLAQRKYVYVRIPKTGSQSLNTALFNITTTADRFRKEDNNPQGFYEAPAKQWWDHLSSQFYKDAMTPEVWNEIISFSIVRNPYARLYSLWKASPAANEKNNFKNWIMSDCPYPGWNTKENSLKHSYVFPASPVTCQKNWLLGKDGKNQVSFTFRLEEIENPDIMSLLKEIVDSHLLQLPVHRYNQTTKTKCEYKDHYDTEMIDKVKKMCVDDLLTFQYDFDGIVEGSENFVLLGDE